MPSPFRDATDGCSEKPVSDTPKNTTIIQCRKTLQFIYTLSHPAED